MTEVTLKPDGLSGPHEVVLHHLGKRALRPRRIVARVMRAYRSFSVEKPNVGDSTILRHAHVQGCLKMDTIEILDESNQLEATPLRFKQVQSYIPLATQPIKANTRLTVF